MSAVRCHPLCPLCRLPSLPEVPMKLPTIHVRWKTVWKTAVAVALFLGERENRATLSKLPVKVPEGVYTAAGVVAIIAAAQGEKAVRRKAPASEP